jgi:hypothetical protein
MGKYRVAGMGCRARMTGRELVDAPPPGFAVLPRPKEAEGERKIKFPAPKITLDIVPNMFHLPLMPSQTGSGSRR